MLLFFSACFLHEVRGEELRARLAEHLRERVLECAGCSGDALALALRVLVGAAVGLRVERDLAALLPLRCGDGGRELSWIHKYGSSDVKIDNRGLSTALALNVIAVLHAPAVPGGARVGVGEISYKERSYTVEIMTALVALP